MLRVLVLRLANVPCWDSFLLGVDLIEKIIHKCIWVWAVFAPFGVEVWEHLFWRLCSSSNGSFTLSKVWMVLDLRAWWELKVWVMRLIKHRLVLDLLLDLLSHLCLLGLSNHLGILLMDQLYFSLFLQFHIIFYFLYFLFKCFQNYFFFRGSFECFKFFLFLQFCFRNLFNFLCDEPFSKIYNLLLFIGL